MKSLFILILSLLCLGNSFTGPSVLSIEINPISFNTEEGLLAKTRYYENRMGAYGPVAVEYGFCVIKHGRIQEYKGVRIDEEADDYEREVDIWDKVFNAETSRQQLIEINKFLGLSFSELNQSQFKVGKTFVLDDFEGKYQLDLSADKQLGLKNGHSESYSDSIRVKYDFGDFLLIENYTVDDYESEDWSIVGASFDYNNQCY